jgi:hypothetical protein
VRARELARRRADVHAGVVENQIVEMDELAFQPQTGAGVGEVSPGDPPGADRALGESLVEARQRILRGRERARNGYPGERIWDLGAGLQGLDNLNGDM